MNPAARLLRRLVAIIATAAILCTHPDVAIPQDRPIDTPAVIIPAPSLATEPEYLFAAPTRADRIGRVLAPVMINGQGPFRLLVDTGANQSVLTTRLAQTLGLMIDSTSPVRLNGVTGAVLVPTVNVESFETGDLRQEGLRLPVMSSVAGSADGVLGMHGFDGKRITVDFVDDQIKIANSRGQRAPRNFARLPIKIRFNRLLLAPARVGGVRTQAVIDTGAERTLGNLPLLRELQKRRKIRATPISTTVIGMSEAVQRGDSIFTRSIQLGDLSVNDVDVIYGNIDVFRLWDLEDEPALLIGMDILGTVHTLVIDYRLKELQIRPRD